MGYGLTLRPSTLRHWKQRSDPSGARGPGREGVSRVPVPCRSGLVGGGAGFDQIWTWSSRALLCCVAVLWPHLPAKQIETSRWPAWGRGTRGACSWTSQPPSPAKTKRAGSARGPVFGRPSLGLLSSGLHQTPLSLFAELSFIFD
jgi:hypothetical protein